jgi:4'-phosphopantetheinyl transferase
MVVFSETQYYRNGSKVNGHVSLCIIRADFSKIDKLKNEFLHNDELYSLASYTHEKKKMSFLLGRYASKNALCLLDTYKKPAVFYHIENGPLGEPFVTNADYQISISHTNNWATAIASTKPIPFGIDIEEISNLDKIDLTSFYLNMEEYFMFDFTDPNAIKCSIWAAKEALSKLLKSGLTIDYNLLSLKNVKSHGNVMHIEFKNFHAYKALLFKYNDCIICIATYKNVEINNLFIKLEKLGYIFPYK